MFTQNTFYFFDLDLPQRPRLAFLFARGRRNIKSYLAKSLYQVLRIFYFDLKLTALFVQPPQYRNWTNFMEYFEHYIKGCYGYPPLYVCAPLGDK